MQLCPQEECVPITSTRSEWLATLSRNASPVDAEEQARLVVRSAESEAYEPLLRALGTSPGKCQDNQAAVVAGQAVVAIQVRTRPMRLGARIPDEGFYRRPKGKQWEEKRLPPGEWLSLDSDWRRVRRRGFRSGLSPSIPS